jgi:hypothetical protein
MEFIEQPKEGIAGADSVIASDVNKWFTHLKEKGAKRIKLHYRISGSELPNRNSAAFVRGGSNWFIEVQYEKKNNLYSGGHR